MFFEKMYFYDDWILCGFSLADELYAWVDKRYGDLADSFGIAQSWLGLNMLSPVAPQIYTVPFHSKPG